MPPFSVFCTAIHSFVTGARDFNFPTMPIKSLPRKGRNQGHVTRFKILYPVKYLILRTGWLCQVVNYALW